MVQLLSGKQTLQEASLLDHLEMGIAIIHTSKHFRTEVPDE
jgi:hypothetical protein